MTDCITVDPGVMDGQPHIRGTRLTVRRIFDSLTQHKSCSKLLAEHPGLDWDDLRAAAEFAALHYGPATRC